VPGTHEKKSIEEYHLDLWTCPGLQIECVSAYFTHLKMPKIALEMSDTFLQHKNLLFLGVKLPPPPPDMKNMTPNALKCTLLP
jgi:hypothetical protein